MARPRRLSLALALVSSLGSAGPGLAAPPSSTDPVRVTQVTGLVLAPPAGSITRFPGVSVRGTVTGNRPPLTLTLFLDGILTSRLTNLPQGQSVAPGISLVGEGPHRISVEVTDASGATDRQEAGTITLDTTPPPPPVLIEPAPGTSTNQDIIMIRGRLAELGPVPANGQFPRITILVTPPAPVEPSASFAVTDPAGQFVARLNLTGRPDGEYQLRIIAADPAGNESTTATSSVGSGRGSRPATATAAPTSSRAEPLREAIRAARRAGDRELEASLRALLGRLALELAR